MKTRILFFVVLVGLHVACSLNGQNLVADYRFDSSLESAAGSIPDLEVIGDPVFQTETVDGVERTVLAFEAGEGCRLLNARQFLSGAESYTIVVLFRFEENTSWRRVVDFRNRKSDLGLYSYYGNLNYYNILTGSGGAIQPGQYVQITLTRNAQGSMRGYVNGVPEIDYSDGDGTAIVDEDDILSFFQDDLAVSGEHSAGAVSRIRIWDGPLDEAVVSGLDRASGGTVMPPMVSSPLMVSVVSGAFLDYQITATNTPIGFSATNLQPWMVFDPETGSISGTADISGVFEVGISALNAGGSGSGTLRVTVEPATGASLGFALASLRVAENAGTVEITVLRQGETGGEVTVDFATVAGDTTAGTDFTATSGTLIFGDGETEKTISLDIHFNRESEPDEVLFLQLSNPVNVDIAAPTSLRIVIADTAVTDPQATIAYAVAIKWTSLAGVFYRVVYANDPNAESWETLYDSIEGTGGETRVFDEITTPKRFYRVEISTGAN